MVLAPPPGDLAEDEPRADGWRKYVGVAISGAILVFGGLALYFIFGGLEERGEERVHLEWNLYEWLTENWQMALQYALVVAFLLVAIGIAALAQSGHRRASRRRS